MPNIVKTKRDIRVRDVKNSVPLVAYERAGVAFNMNDRVTEEDIQAAENAWELMCIAEDVQSQWGALD